MKKPPNEKRYHIVKNVNESDHGEGYKVMKLNRRENALAQIALEKFPVFHQLLGFFNGKLYP